MLILIKKNYNYMNILQQDFVAYLLSNIMFAADFFSEIF